VTVTPLKGERNNDFFIIYCSIGYMLHRYGCIGCILDADIRSTRGFTTDVIIPKYKFGCIQYRWMYNILGGFIMMRFADIFSDGETGRQSR
jgi:hypothetical protein